MSCMLYWPIAFIYFRTYIISVDIDGAKLIFCVTYIGLLLPLYTSFQFILYLLLMSVSDVYLVVKVKGVVLIGGGAQNREGYKGVALI